jgi:hypothetical protein
MEGRKEERERERGRERERERNMGVRKKSDRINDLCYLLTRVTNLFVNVFRDQKQQHIIITLSKIIYLWVKTFRKKIKNPF